MTSLGCVDGNNKVQTIDLTRVFSSVQKFVMRQNFPGSETFNEYALVPGGGATTTLLAQGDLSASTLLNIDQVQIVTPLLGSILLANSDFLVRWTVAPTSSYYPTLFNLTILDASTQQPLSPDLVGPNPVYVNSNSFFIDKSLGDDLTTNATKWSIPANLTNGRYRLQWTGISGLTTSSVTSDPFIVGPVKPSTSK
ncbi:hypothetical protein DFJ73DRAFT_837615 [Zopfochytrium polystomum]|nr:hypothetical protein DFJ73DRAFT_837615 [Zopfochytrium polystomum]